MKQKIFIISIPMQPEENLKLLRYRYRDGALSSPTRFPGVALLEKYAVGKAPVKVVTVRTDDDNGYTERCYGLFHEELCQLAERFGVRLKIDAEIIVPHEESVEKECVLLKELFACFDRGSEIYMDLTYGTKLTAIELFSSLYYAEIVEKCGVQAVVYGKYAFNGSTEGELFDATRLYHTVRFLDAAAHMDRNSFVDLIGQTLAPEE